MRFLKTTGDKFHDKEIDALWRAIEDLKGLKAPAEKASGIEQVIRQAVTLIVQEQDGSPRLTKEGIEFGPEFTVSESSNLARVVFNVLTTKGDLLTYYSSALQRLGVGTDGHVLTADSTQTAGIKWAAVASGSPKQALDLWYYNNVGANLVTVAVPKIGDAEHDGFDGKWIAPAAGSVIGVAVKSNAARTAGNAEVNCQKNGVDIGLDATLDGTNTIFDTTTQAAGLDTFVAGDEFGFTLDTSLDWAPTTADLRALMFVQWS